MEDDLTVERSGAYTTSDPSADGSFRVNRRLAGEFREKVRQFAVTTPFTPAWERMVEVVQFLTSVALIEEREARAKREEKEHSEASLSTSANFKPVDSQTLWEREEFCARQIVEEGKTNLFMRTLAEFKSALIQRLSKGQPLPAPTSSSATVYEVGLGVLLRVTMVAVEAIQTLDLRAMLDHFSLTYDYVLSDSYAPPLSITAPRGRNAVASFDFLALQEGCSFNLLGAIFKFLGNLQEDVFMEKFLDLRLHDKMLRVAEKLQHVLATLPEAKALVISDEASDQINEFSNTLCFCWAHLFATETYRSKTAAFWPGGRPEKQRFVALFAPLARSSLTERPEWKKDLRPLSDNLLRFS